MPADPLIIEFVLRTWIESLPAAQDVSLKVYPWAKAPQGTATRPFCLYHRVSSGRLRSLSGPSGVSYPTIQLDFVSRDYDEVRRVASAVRTALEAIQHGYLMGDHTIQSAIVGDLMDATDADVDPAHGDQASEFRVSMDVKIWFVEGG